MQLTEGYDHDLTPEEKQVFQAMGVSQHYRPVKLTPAQDQLLQTVDPMVAFGQLVEDGVIPKDETQNFLIIEDHSKCMPGIVR